MPVAKKTPTPKVAKKAATATIKPKTVKAVRIIGTLLTDTTELNKAIAAFSVRAGKVNIEVHTLACSILLHVDKHHDVTLADRLVAGLPKMGSKNNLREWFLRFGKIVFDDKAKAFRYDSSKVTLLDEAKAITFWSDKWQEHTSKPFDAQKAIAGLLTKVVKASKIGGVIPADTVMHLQKAYDILVKHGTQPVNMATGEQARPVPGDPLANPAVVGEAIPA